MSKDDSGQREEAIFEAMLEIPAEERTARLEAVCGDDVPLRRGIEALLRAHEKAVGRFLEQPPVALGFNKTVLCITEKVGDRIGRYKLLQQIGEGGCGVVYMAEQEEPIHRRVALKVIKLGMDTKSVIARFEAERQALAMMDHPNIAKVLDAGATETGRPFFVMELVRGIKITDYCDQENLSTGERLALFTQVCHAIQHAHQKGIIHRDIKPSNILVTVNDGEAVPKVIDFGIAKATQGRLTDQTLFTAFEQFIGTPAYMSPEQAVMTSLDLDTRSDVYSLGVLLYELLTGKTPFDSKELLEAGLDEMRRTIREKEPARPSTRLSTMIEADLTTIAKHRQSDAPRLVHLLRGDLDWIVMKALEKNRSRRYETVNGLASDIERHLNSEPVKARPPSTLYLFQKMVQRNKLAFAAAGAVAASLLIGLAVSTSLFLKEKSARQRASAAEQEQNRQRQRAETARADETRQRQQAEAARKAAQTEAQRAEAAALQAKLSLSESDFSRAVSLIEEDRATDALAYLMRSLTLNPTNEAALTRLTTLLTYRSWMTPSLLFRNCCFLRLSPDGQWIVTASSDGTARVWNAHNGQPLTKPMKHDNKVLSAQFSPDGTKVVTASADSTARIWDARSGDPLTGPLKHGGKVWSAQFSPDGKSVATASSDKTARIWDVQTGQPLTRPLEHTNDVFLVQFTSDGSRLVTAFFNNVAMVWDARSGQPLAGPLKDSGVVAWESMMMEDGHEVNNWSDFTPRVWRAQKGEMFTNLSKLSYEGGSVHFSPDGERVVIASLDGTARVLDAQTGRPLGADLKHGAGVHSAQFSSDGRRIVTASSEGTARVWRAKNSQPLTEPLQHTNFVFWAEFSPDGKRVVTFALDSCMRVWDVQNASALGLRLNHRAYVNSAHFSPDGLQIVTASHDRTAQVWDAQSGKPVGPPMKHKGDLNAAEFSPDGKWIVTASDDKTARVWDAQTGQPVTDPLMHQDGVSAAHFSKDGRRLITISAKIVRVWKVLSGQLATRPMEHTNWVSLAQFNQDETRILTASNDGTAHTWDSENGNSLSVFQLRVDCYSRDGKLLLANERSSERVYNVESGLALTGPLRHNAMIHGIDFSPDGKRVVTASVDGPARVWDAQTGRELSEPMKHSRAVFDAVFSPDGKRIVTSCYDGKVRVWDSESGQALTDAFRYAYRVGSTEFSPDGKRLMVAFGNSVFVWDIAPPSTKWPGWLLELAEAVSGRTLGETSVVQSSTKNRLETINRIRQKLDHSSDDDGWSNWGRWFLSEPSTRAISPSSRINVADYLEGLIKENSEESLEIAEQLAIGNNNLLSSITAVQERQEKEKRYRAEVDSAADSENPAVELSRLIETHPENHLAYHELASILLRNGDLEGYRRLRATVLARFGSKTDPVVAARMANDCLMLPWSRPGLETVAQMAETAVAAGKDHPEYPFFQVVKSMAEYRQGRFASAAECARDVLASGFSGSGTVEAHMVLGMAEHELKHPEEARAALAKGIALGRSSYPNLETDDFGMVPRYYIIGRVLLKEARELIEGPQKPSGPKQ